MEVFGDSRYSALFMNKASFLHIIRNNSDCPKKMCCLVAMGCLFMSDAWAQLLGFSALFCHNVDFLIGCSLCDKMFFYFLTSDGKVFWEEKAQVAGL